jgi:hypothetical protein
VQREQQKKLKLWNFLSIPISIIETDETVMVSRNRRVEGVWLGETIKTQKLCWWKAEFFQNETTFFL